MFIVSTEVRFFHLKKEKESKKAAQPYNSQPKKKGFIKRL